MTAKGASRNAEGTITVRPAPSSDNSEPAFGDADTTRIVDENKPASNVGARIVASDSDTLTYTLRSRWPRELQHRQQRSVKDQRGTGSRGLDDTQASSPSQLPTHQLQATVSDVTVNVGDVNEAPMIISRPHQTGL